MYMINALIISAYMHTSIYVQLLPLIDQECVPRPPVDV